jgi:RNA polymerase sigma factor (sigma-70 family)
MVWRVCLRILRNHHDAEDAFQATFLVFVRKAASISPRARVGNWLYGVAHQTALNARGSRAKREVRERKAADMPEPVRTEQKLWNDLQSALDQELSRLPDKYRTVIVLCDLEGQTKRAVAQQLGLPEGTVASRVARARTLLAKRLAAKGVRLSGGALAAVLSEQAATAGVPPAVLAHTIQAVTRVAAGLAVTGQVSVKVAVLTEGVMKAMLLSKLKIATVMILLAGVIAVGGGLLSYQPAGAQQGPAAKTGRGIKGKAENRPARSDQEAMQGRWKVVGWEVNGWSEPNGYYTAARIIGDKIFFRIGKDRVGDVQGYSFRLNEDQTPKQIDWVGTEGAIKGMVGPAGIYHLDGDRLVLCLLTPSKERSRPTQFETEPDDGLWLIVLQREQPIVPLVSPATGKQPPDPRQAGPRDDGAEGRPIEMLQGTWYLRNLEQSGKQPAFLVRKFVIGVDRIAVEIPSAPRTEFRYVLRPTANPKQIDLIHTFGVKEGKTLKGIYRLEGNRLFLCLNQAEDGVRPARFAAEAGTKVELMLFEREEGEEGGMAARDVAGKAKQRTEFKIGAVSYKLPFALPSEDEILAALPAKNRPKNSRLECELMRYQINPPRFYPGVGNARLVNAHFRFTVFNLETGSTVVGNIDKDHLIPEK